MDLFSKLRALPSVAQVSNLDNTQILPLRCTFYICPKMNGFKLNQTKTGFTTHYSVEIADSTKDRLKRAMRFAAETQAIGITTQLLAIFAAADAELFFPQPVTPPEPPKGLRCATNLNTFRAQRSRFWALYKEEPWLNMPLRFAQAEAERLVTMLPTSQQATVRKRSCNAPAAPETWPRI